MCEGVQIHVTDAASYKPVQTALHIFDAVIKVSEPDNLSFNPPPYEYEDVLMPFDILSGDEKMRESLVKRLPVKIEIERWNDETSLFMREFSEIALYS